MTAARHVATAGPGSPGIDRLQEVVHSLSHDLKAPTRQIVAFGAMLEAAAQSDMDGESRHYLTRIVEAAATLDGKIDGLNRYATAISASYGAGPGQPADAAHQALGDLDGTVGGAVGEATVVIDPMPAVDASEKRLAVIFRELLDNSLKFCPTVAEIRISAIDNADMVDITVGDNGPGFGVREPERALALFTRLHRTTTPGSGIGLSIVRHLVDDVGGRVTLTDSGGAGARITIALPGIGDHSTTGVDR